MEDEGIWEYWVVKNNRCRVQKSKESWGNEILNCRVGLTVYYRLLSMGWVLRELYQINIINRVVVCGLYKMYVWNI